MYWPLLKIVTVTLWIKLKWKKMVMDNFSWFLTPHPGDFSVYITTIDGRPINGSPVKIFICM